MAATGMDASPPNSRDGQATAKRESLASVGTRSRGGSGGLEPTRERAANPESAKRLVQRKRVPKIASPITFVEMAAPALLPRWPEHRLLELAPLNWTKTRELVALLDADPFRCASL